MGARIRSAGRSAEVSGKLAGRPSDPSHWCRPEIVEGKIRSAAWPSMLPCC